MKFIDKLFGKKKAENPSLKLKIDEIPQFISEESEKEFNELKPFILNKYKEINSSIGAIPEVIDSLLTAEVVESANKRVEKVGDANKDNLVNNLRSIIEKVVTPEDTSLQSAFEFCIITKSTLKTVLENTHKSQLYIKAIYPEESQKIISALSSLEDRVDELLVPLRNKKARMDSFDKFSEEISNYNKMKKHIHESQTKVGQFESRIASMKKDILDAKNRLNELENSREFERAKQLEDEVSNLKEQLSDVDHNIQRLFSPMSKVFSRMEKQDKSEICVLSPEHRQILEKITHDPASALEHDLDSFFAEVKPRIENGSLGLKDQMCEKALQQVEKLHNSKDLASLREKRKEYSLQLESAMNELNSLSVYRDKEQLVKQISRDEHMLKTLEEDLDMEKKHLDSLTAECQLLRSGLSKEIKGLFEKDIEIEY
ncbi:hypothetical protein [uncultured Methanomethylovorans sp.]|uniref:hypothetical protein n=1 Tax=uncultured Methanomethylovorans sp. TaxID=183759 RepID=UPI002AA78D3B|nr:hypothetical protein [uncultured Methanomethylovorans sp.]